MKIKLFCKNLGVILLANLLMGCANGSPIGSNPTKTPNPDDPCSSFALINSEDLYESEVSFDGSFASPQQDYMYKTLVAEIARLRGNNALAAEYFFEIAIKTRDQRFAERATETAMYAKKFDIAMKAAYLWTTIVPNNSHARQILAGLLLRQNCTFEAIKHIEAITDILKGSPQQLKLVLETMLKQQPSSSLKFMEELLKKRQNHPVMLLIYSRLLIQAKQLKQAQEVLHKLLVLVPDHDEAVPLYAYLLKVQNQRLAARQWMETALNKYQDKAEWRFIYARMLAEAEQFEEAIRQFQRLLLKYPQHSEILYTLGALSIQTKQLSIAKGYFQKLIKVGERVNAAKYYLGQIAYDEKDLEKALFWYYQVKQETNYFLNAQARIAYILVELGQFDKAIEHLQTVVLKSDDPEEMISLMLFEAELLVEQEHHHQAMEAYNRALRLKADNVDALYMQALLYETMGSMSKMEQNLRRVLILAPENIDALNALGYSLTEHSARYQEAYRLIKQALTLNPNNYYILDSMGWVLYKMGNYVEAIAYLRKAQSQQNDPEVAAHLIQVLWANGEYQAARQELEQAIKAFPDDEKLREVANSFLE